MQGPSCHRDHCDRQLFHSNLLSGPTFIIPCARDSVQNRPVIVVRNFARRTIAIRKRCAFLCRSQQAIIFALAVNPGNRSSLERYSPLCRIDSVPIVRKHFSVIDDSGQFKNASPLGLAKANQILRNIAELTSAKMLKCFPQVTNCCLNPILA